MYQDLYDKANKIIAKDTCMKFYDVLKSLYLKMDRVGLLQVRGGMNCGHDEVPDNAILLLTVLANKGLSSVEWWYSNIEWEALGILHGLKSFITTVLLRRYT